MNPEIAAALTVFVFSTLFLPGPNNLLLLASSASFGWRATLPHIFGSVVSATLLMAASVIGLSGLILTMPAMEALLKFGGGIWLIGFGVQYVWAVFRPARVQGDMSSDCSRPFSFSEAAVFQWVNPSVMIFTLVIVSAFADVSDIVTARIFVICSIFSAIALLAMLTWSMLGHPLSRLFQSRKWGAILHGVMGTLIILSACKIITS